MFRSTIYTIRRWRCNFSKECSELLCSTRCTAERRTYLCLRSFDCLSNADLSQRSCCVLYPTQNRRHRIFTRVKKADSLGGGHVTVPVYRSDYRSTFCLSFFQLSYRARVSYLLDLQEVGRRSCDRSCDRDLTAAQAVDICTCICLGERVRHLRVHHRPDQDSLEEFSYTR